MRRMSCLSFFWVFALGLSACDASGSGARNVLVRDDAGESGDDEQPSSADTTGRTDSDERGSGRAGAPGKSDPGNSGADDLDAGTPAATCGGFAGFTCAGLGRCADDEADDCDPDRGGADCAGICICDVKAKCRDGQTWNADPAACRCEDPTEVEADAGGADAGEAPMDCGGSAAFECPGAGTCEDDPDDACDPSEGAECAGVCQCTVLGVCIAPAVWNPSADVCACES
jgi:hypothetical protein